MPLTPHQQEKHDEIIALFRAGHRRVILEGSAGTGKTYTADEIVKTIKKDYTINPIYNNGTIQVCAPSNKAVAVIAARISSNVIFSTIHSALKLYPYTHPRTGIEVFKKRVAGRPKPDDFDKCKFALIDESSMLGKSIEGSVTNKEREPEDVMKGHLENYKFPILYMGDNKQLPPVKEDYSPVFYKGYPVVTLTEIKRQSADNPIIALSNDTDLLFFKQPNIINGKGYLYSEAEDQFIENLAESNGSDEFKYIAYMNDVVDRLNRATRERIYGTPKKIEQNETIVFNKPFLKHYTNEELKVTDLDIITDYIYIPTAKTKWDANGDHTGPMDKIKLKYYRINDEINIVHEQSEKIFRDIHLSVKIKCATEDWSYLSKKYIENKIFADFKYNHAITVHKAQGSTYKQVVLNIGNMMFNKKADERQRMLYTAITRASDLIILNNVK